VGSGGRNREQQNYWNVAAQQAAPAITQQDPLEQAYRARQQSVLDWENQPGHDVRDMPGMGDAVQIGQAAINRSNQDRMGNGAFNLADPNSGYATQLKEQKRNELGQEVGAGLENARAQISGEAHGSVLPFSQLTTNRNIARGNLAAGMFGQWNQRKSKNWWDYLTDTVSMASQAAGAFM
jgi:hypothetical protein